MVHEGRNGRRDTGICGRRERVTRTPLLSETHTEKREGTVAEGAGGLGEKIVFLARAGEFQLLAVGKDRLCIVLLVGQYLGSAG
jgi:hypothetical protein